MKTPQDRFDEKWVEDANGCWIWIGSIHPHGYGLFSPWTGKVMHAHRAAWFLFNGEIEDGVLCCHHCDVRNCVNPEHLFLGSAKDNANDMREKGRENLSRSKQCRPGESAGSARLSGRLA